MNIKSVPCIARLVDLGPNTNRLVSVLASCPCYGAQAQMWKIETLQTMVDVLTHGPDLPAGWHECMPDTHLRPLHDGDGVDEVLRRVGRPEPIDVPVPAITARLMAMGLACRWWP